MSEAAATEPKSGTQTRATKAKSTAAGLLVGLDGSSGSQHALEWAAARTDRFGLIQPLTTWHYPWWSFTGPMPPPAGEFKKLAEQQALSVLGSIPPDRYLPLITCQGQAGPTLVDVGATSNLIVVGTRGHSGLKDTLLGSISSHVVANAKSPVAVVPAGAPIMDVHRRVVVGVDGSTNSVQALLWAFENAESGSIIEAVHTWVYPAAALPEMTLNPRSDFEAWARTALDETVDTAVENRRNEHGDEPEQEIVKRLEYGDPRHVLRECQDSSDLLVVGARGQGLVAHLLLGSVTSALVHRPVTTMVVVPAADADRAG